MSAEELLGLPLAEALERWRAAGQPDPELEENPFHDVDDDAYYLKAVLWAVEQGITQGKEQERQKMILVMANLLRGTGLSENEIIGKITGSTGLSESDVCRYVYGGNE